MIPIAELSTWARTVFVSVLEALTPAFELLIETPAAPDNATDAAQAVAAIVARLSAASVTPPVVAFTP